MIMNPHLEYILKSIQQSGELTEEEKSSLAKAVKAVDKELTILEFKLDRTEKVKRTTSILLEETINELEEKRKAVEESNEALRKSIEELHAVQEQLIQQEKLASLGQLTAGIAHEIKNPLNFVNNFADLSIELIEEVFEELDSIENSPAKEEITAILNDIKMNLGKIHEHGSRADGIVKSMLLHSRGGSGEREPTDLNAFISEYVNLAFHGMRAGKDPINVSIDLDLDEKVGEIPLVVEDFSRVILNLCNNAFDAMRSKLATAGYHPRLTVRTSQEKNGIRIEVTDNGPGIPEAIRDKILQPFFTTKKGTEGTGLGLSITHDIIKAHGGTLKVHTEIGQGSTFEIALP